MDGSTVPAVFTVALLLAALGLKITDAAKAIVNLRNTDTKKAAQNDLVTLVVTVVLSFLVIQFWVKTSAWGDEVTIGAEKLKDLNFQSTFLFSAVFTALAGTLHDFKKAVSGNGSGGEEGKKTDELKFING